MAKITLKLDIRRAKRDGTYPLKVAIYRGGKTVYMPIDLSLKKEEWNRDKQEVVKRSDRRELNILLQDKLASLNAELLKIQLNGELKGMTNKQLIAKLSGNDKQEPVNILNFYEAFVQNISNERTRDIYEVTLRKVRSFAGNQLTFEDITPSWLRAFEAFLAQTAPRVNARAIHLRNLRAVLNAAIDEEITSNYPFRRFKIKTQQTAKRALTAEQLLQLRDAKVGSYQQKYIDLFFLGFYLIGINMVDLSRLRPFDGDRIVYERAKTHKLYSIKVEPEAREIIERYRGTELLLSLFEGIKSYRSFANRMNQNLKRIGEELNLGEVTYYCCRHSWATLAAELDVPDDVISLALGHTKTNVTEVYIRRNHAKVDEANRRVIDFLWSAKVKTN